MNNKMQKSPIGESWSSYRAQHYTPEERAENDFVAKLVGEVIQTRKSQNLSQRELASISGIKQSVIARMETGKTDPRLSTVMKLLSTMGKTLSIVPLKAE
ncbi:MAG: helix-turn-helix transcriptional regulator [Roseburia sp.]|nr:helix-turn-helix transcriptional regulator [Roseburia sp.]MCM1243461.1 helix-turn-helix transcriptional regulator [Roseburia sp.]